MSYSTFGHPSFEGPYESPQEAKLRKYHDLVLENGFALVPDMHLERESLFKRIGRDTTIIDFRSFRQIAGSTLRIEKMLGLPMDSGFVVSRIDDERFAKHLEKLFRKRVRKPNSEEARLFERLFAAYAIPHSEEWKLRKAVRGSV